jgi:hypothetical protein
LIFLIKKQVFRNSNLVLKIVHLHSWKKKLCIFILEKKNVHVGPRGNATRRQHLQPHLPGILFRFLNQLLSGSFHTFSSTLVPFFKELKLAEERERERAVVAGGRPSHCSHDAALIAFE